MISTRVLSMERQKQQWKGKWWNLTRIWRSQALVPFHRLGAIAIVRWEKFLFRERFVCESHEISRSDPYVWGCVWERADEKARKDESCSVCRELEKKIWFRGWSWTTYNNELNICHSVYLHHKEINVSSTFERKICDVGVWGMAAGFIGFSCACVLRALTTLYLSVSVPLPSQITRRHYFGEKKKDLTI